MIRSAFLSASRVERGAPVTQVAGTKAGLNSGMLTSGSFTVEGIYQFSNSVTGSTHFTTQSLFRLAATGTVGSTIVKPSVFTNVLAHKPDIETGVTGTIFVYSSDKKNTAHDLPLSMSLQSVDIFDGNPWHVAFGRNSLTHGSASYFISARRAGIEGPTVFKASQIRNQQKANAAGSFSQYNLQSQASGCFICVGSQSIETRGDGAIGHTSDYYLNGATFPTASRATEFSGKLAQLRFWSTALKRGRACNTCARSRFFGCCQPKC